MTVDKDEIMKAWLAKPDHTQIENKDFSVADALDRLRPAAAAVPKEAQLTDGTRIYQAAIKSKYLNKEELDALKKTPVLLAPWDPFGTLAD